MKKIMCLLFLFFNYFMIGYTQDNTLEVEGANGELNAQITSLGSDPNRGLMILTDENGVFKSSIGVGDAGQGFLSLNGPNQSLNANFSYFTNFPNNGVFTLNDTQGDFKYVAFVSEANTGGLSLIGANGIGNVSIGGITEFPNNGFIDVRDQNGIAKAGCFVDANGDGLLFATLKPFRIDHPTRPEHEIWYTCVEGPEVAAYDRGTAKLKDGEAFIFFPEHFSAIINEKTMTVNLTPLDADTYGLAVIEKTITGFKVKELKGGSGNFEFDWEVKCVRKGYEDFEVVRLKADFPLRKMDLQNVEISNENNKY